MSVVDTNTLVHSSIDRSPFHVQALRAVEALGSGPMAITRQIVREYLAVVTRPQSFMEPVPLQHAISNVERLTGRLTMLEDGPGVWAKLQWLGERFSFGGKQVHDANIVATMLAHGETRILTFNGKDFRRFAPLIEVIEP